VVISHLYGELRYTFLMIIRAFLLIFFIVFVFTSTAFLNPIPTRKIKTGDRPLYGVSYSFEQAGWFGVDARKDYVRMLEEFKFDWVRLPFFWNQMVDPTTGDFNKNFDDLKFAIEEAQKHNVGVIMAIGAKTPYFPEYHWPKNIESQVKFGEVVGFDHKVADDILAMDKKVVKELSAFDNIIYWQVENEPLVGNVNKWKIDPSLISQEADVVRQSDSKHRPIILNHAATGFYDNSWRRLLPILKKGDVFAVNAFFKTKGTDFITAKVLGREIHVLWPDHFVWPVQSWFAFSPDFSKIKKEIEVNGNDLWVLEMQSEPYIKKIEEAKDPVLSFEPEDILAGEKFLRSYQIKSIGFWGVHFWQYRQSQGDFLWKDTVKRIVN